MGGKTSAKAKNTWIAKAYDRINLTVSKGKKETIQAAAAAVGESVNAFINSAVDARMGTRDAQKPAGGPQEAAGALSAVRAVYLPPDAFKAAQEAAEASKEALPVFVTRAVEMQAERDKIIRKMKGGKPNE